MRVIPDFRVTPPAGEQRVTFASPALRQLPDRRAIFVLLITIQSIWYKMASINVSVRLSDGSKMDVSAVSDGTVLDLKKVCMRIANKVDELLLGFSLRI